SLGRLVQRVGRERKRQTFVRYAPPSADHGAIYGRQSGALGDFLARSRSSGAAAIATAADFRDSDRERRLAQKRTTARTGIGRDALTGRVVIVAAPHELRSTLPGPQQ